MATGVGRAVSYYDQASFRNGTGETRYGPLDIGGVILDRSKSDLDPKRCGGDLGPSQVDIIVRSRLGVSHESSVCNLRFNLLEHEQVLAAHALFVHRKACKISLWICQATDETLRDGI